MGPRMIDTPFHESLDFFLTIYHSFSVPSCAPNVHIRQRFLGTWFQRYALADRIYPPFMFYARKSSVLGIGDLLYDIARHPRKCI